MRRPERSDPSRVRSMNGSSTGDNVPSEARKRESGGGSPRKYDDLLTGPSDLDVPTTV
jgi:hypothetical protein